MVDQHSDADQVSEAESPTAVNGFQSATPCQADDAGFAALLAFGGICDSSVLTKMGPRDYCGFEMDTTGRFDSPGFEGMLAPSPVEAPGEGIHVDRGPGDSRRAELPSASGRRAGLAPAQTMHQERANGAAADPWGDIGEPGRPHVGLFSRLRPPEVPGYEILGELGRGGMGVVYKARQCRLNRLVALKMILAGDYAGPDAVERIMAEAEIVARLQHANIVQIYATGDCDGRPYVELEYVGGGASRIVSTELHGPRAQPRGWLRAWPSPWPRRTGWGSSTVT